VTRLQLYPAGDPQWEGEYPDDELASHYGENGASQTGTLAVGALVSHHQLVL
jgi:hypothetical protein